MMEKSVRRISKKVRRIQSLFALLEKDDQACGEEEDPFASCSGSSTLVKVDDNPLNSGEEFTRAGMAREKQSRPRSRKLRATCESDLTKPTQHRVNRKSLRCKLCKKTFCERRDLDSHMLSHLGTESYHCNVCRKSFVSKRKLFEHARSACSASVDEPYQFTTLKRRYTTKGNIVTYVAKKSQRNHECLICEKSFAHRHNLAAHMRHHTDEKPHQCYVCDKSFAIKDYLTRHMRIHTGEKPYQCSVCEKSFRTKNHLNRHMLVHSGVKPHRCTICGKNLARKEYLIVHMRAHYGASDPDLRPI